MMEKTKKLINKRNMRVWMKKTNIDTGSFWKCCFGVFSTVGVCLFADTAFAQDTNQNLGGIAQNITSSFQNIGKLMIAISYVSGIGFAIASIFKFKQHKDNPTQIPLGTPIALMAIAISLVFLPAFLKPAGYTLLGDKVGDISQEAGGFTGTGAENIPGGKTGTSNIGG